MSSPIFPPAGGPFQRKFYDVKCARFDPVKCVSLILTHLCPPGLIFFSPDIFVSTGLDGTLTVWNSQSDIQQGPHPTFYSVTTVEEHYEPVKKWGKGMYLISAETDFDPMLETYHGHSCHDIIYRQHNVTDRNSLFAAPCDNGLVPALIS